MKHVVYLGGFVLCLAACGQGRDQISFDGEVFRSNAKALERSNRQSFVATASPASASVEGAIQAAEYEAFQHCLQYFGTTDIDWRAGPDSDPQSLVADDTVSLSGTCRDVAG